MTAKCPQLVRAAERPPEVRFQHPLNPASELHGHLLGRLTGLARTGVNLAHVPPGKESFAYHAHHAEEEWIYVLAGRGIAEIDGAEYEVGPGDFMGFPTPSVAHHLRNPFAEELVYLTGGESRDVEVADFPRLGLRMTRTVQGAFVAPLDQFRKIG
jgi:uncharacterized cupin superfamily protein